MQAHRHLAKNGRGTLQDADVSVESHIWSVSEALATRVALRTQPKEESGVSSHPMVERLRPRSAEYIVFSEEAREPIE